MHIIVLMTVHNRKNKSLTCLESLFRTIPPGFRVSVVVVDSGSDGTGAELEHRYDNVKTIPAAADTYWAAGMFRAWEYVTTILHPTDSGYCLMWLNDDVILRPNWLRLLIGQAKLPEDGVVYVGGCVDCDGESSTYGGFEVSGKFNRLKFRPIFSRGEATDVDTLNGNVVLMTRQTDMRIGGLQSQWTHNLADLDYGLRATKVGCRCILSAEPVGVCQRDGIAQVPAGSSRIENFRIVRQQKHFPPPQWARFCLRHGGIAAPTTFLKPYARAIIKTPTRRRRESER